MDYLLKIKELLRVKKMTQVEFSEKLGVTKTTVNNYLTGKTKIDIETFSKMADILEVSIGYFFDGKSKKEFEGGINQEELDDIDKHVNELIVKIETDLGNTLGQFSESDKDEVFYFKTDHYNLGYVASNNLRPHFFEIVLVISALREKYLWKNTNEDKPPFEIFMKDYTVLPVSDRFNYLNKLKDIAYKFVDFYMSNHQRIIYTWLVEYELYKPTDYSTLKSSGVSDKQIEKLNKQSQASAENAKKTIESKEFKDLFKKLPDKEVDESLDKEIVFKAFQKEFFGFEIFKEIDIDTERDEKLRHY